MTLSAIIFAIIGAAGSVFAIIFGYLSYKRVSGAVKWRRVSQFYIDCDSKSYAIEMYEIINTKETSSIVRIPVKEFISLKLSKNIDYKHNNINDSESITIEMPPKLNISVTICSRRLALFEDITSNNSIVRKYIYNEYEGMNKPWPTLYEIIFPVFLVSLLVGMIIQMISSNVSQVIP